MPQKAAHTVHILEGDATLYKRNSSPHWQLRYKIYNKWMRATTKCESINDAKKRAVDIVLEAKHRQKSGLPAVSKRFSAVAHLAIQRMEELNKGKQGKVTYKTYIQVINKYLIEFFGNHNIDRIDSALMNRFAKWRIEQLGKLPSASVINNHNSALNRVFDEALTRGYMAKIQVPVFNNEGIKTGRRPDFTLEEYKLLYIGMRDWVTEARKGNEETLRRILRDYIQVLFHTGIRAGTEGMSIKWSSIKFFNENEEQYLAIDVRGKTGSREVICRHSTIRYLDRLRKLNPEWRKGAFEKFLARKVDAYVFRDGDTDADAMTTKFGKMFARLLTKLELLHDKRTGKERTLYSLRHTFATLSLTYDRMSIYTLSEQMSTSVKMIEDHYGHVLLRKKADEIAGSFKGLKIKKRQ